MVQGKEKQRGRDDERWAVLAQRVYRKSFGEAAKHEGSHGKMNPSLTRSGVLLVVFGETAAAAQPAESALGYPAAGQHHEARLLFVLAVGQLRVARNGFQAAALPAAGHPRGKLVAPECPYPPRSGASAAPKSPGAFGRAAAWLPRAPGGWRRGPCRPEASRPRRPGGGICGLWFS